MVISIVSGLIFVVIGILFQIFPPKKINILYGYRTSRSMKNQQTWDFSQKMASKELIKTGIVLLGISILLLKISTVSGEVNFIGLFLVIISIGILFLRVESAIKKLK